MRGRVYAQRGNEAGWIRTKDDVSLKSRKDITLTFDVMKATVFDVDNSALVLQDMVNDGWAICCGDSHVLHEINICSPSPVSPML